MKTSLGSLVPRLTRRLSMEVWERHKLTTVQPNHVLINHSRHKIPIINPTWVIPSLSSPLCQSSFRSSSPPPPPSSSTSSIQNDNSDNFASSPSSLSVSTFAPTLPSSSEPLPAFSPPAPSPTEAASRSSAQQPIGSVGQSKRQVVLPQEDDPWV